MPLILIFLDSFFQVKNVHIISNLYIIRVLIDVSYRICCIFLVVSLFMYSCVRNLQLKHGCINLKKTTVDFL
jgi:hypothetical protein